MYVTSQGNPMRSLGPRIMWWLWLSATVTKYSQGLRICEIKLIKLVRGVVLPISYSGSALQLLLTITHFIQIWFSMHKIGASVQWYTVRIIIGGWKGGEIEDVRLWEGVTLLILCFHSYSDLGSGTGSEEWGVSGLACEQKWVANMTTDLQT